MVITKGKEMQYLLENSIFIVFGLYILANAVLLCVVIVDPDAFREEGLAEKCAAYCQISN